ncbi:cysteine hydrolase family protein [Aquibacillus rhizosphaerae]|uniref:Isochorismatase family cysteine hydrolase n=1 Tax=Aquibacillus rhizosphaerae TaxID=3051431 RepID=A0ABT7L9W8_9BACI|nr:isochorismatase family cysteine hydrolase [Aquibacillus sp. LR5S19]MDL4842669.1 isochorismatase family cysteine hydrolase [Aquibacillus sp. LR5S19]
MDDLNFEKENSALLIINMQNAFVHPEGSLSKLGLDTSRTSFAVDSIRQLKEAFQVQRCPIIYIQHKDKEDPDLIAKVFSPNMELKQYVENSWDSEIIDELKPEDGDYIIEKSRFSAFYHTQLDELLRELGVETLVVTGVATNLCVESTIRDAFYREYQVFVPKEATASYTFEQEQGALANFELAFGSVISVKQMLHEMLVLVI